MDKIFSIIIGQSLLVDNSQRIMILIIIALLPIPSICCVALIQIEARTVRSQLSLGMGRVVHLPN